MKCFTFHTIYNILLSDKKYRFARPTSEMEEIAMRLIDADEFKRTLAEIVPSELLSRKDVEALIDNAVTISSEDIIDERERAKMELEANEKRIQELKAEIEWMDEHASKEERWMGKKNTYDDRLGLTLYLKGW